MKKLLLTLVTLITCIGLSFAEEVTLTFGEIYADETSTLELTEIPTGVEGLTIATSNGTNNNNKPTYYNNGKNFRVYSNNTITFSATDLLIKKIVFTTASQKFTTATKVDHGSFSINSGTTTWTDDSSDVDNVTFTIGSSIRITVIAITYEIVSTSAETTAKPSILPDVDLFFDTQKVTIEAEEGASIYYTLDGSDPTTESTPYQDAFEISATTTVKAIAVAEGKDASSIASKTFTLGATYASVADLVAAAPTAQSRIAGPLTIFSVGNKYLFVKDSADAGLLLDSTSNWDTATYKPGMTLSNVIGTFNTSTSGINPRFTPDASSLSPEGDEAQFTPTATTLDELTQAGVYNVYVKLDKQTVSSKQSGSYTNYYIGDDYDVQLYGYTAYTTELRETLDYNVEGVFVKYGTQDELLLTKVELCESEQAPAVPVVTYGDKTVEANEQLSVWPGETISFSIEDATSYVINDAEAVTGSAATITTDDTADEVNIAIYGVNSVGNGESFSFSYKVKAPEALVVSFNGEAIEDETFEVANGKSVTLAADGATSYTVNGETIEGKSYAVSTFGEPITFAAVNAAGEATQVITFTEKEADVYELVTDAEGLVDGGKYIIAYNASESKSLSANNTNKNNFAPEDVTITDNQIIDPSDDVLVLKLEASTATEDTWRLQAYNGSESNIGKYLYNTSGNNYLRLTDDPGTTSDYTITITTDGFATISNSSRSIQYNNSSKIFSSYTSGQKSVQLYRLKEAEQPSEPTEPESAFRNSDDEYTYTGEAKVIYVAGDEIWFEEGQNHFAGVAYGIDASNFKAGYTYTNFNIAGSKHEIEGADSYFEGFITSAGEEVATDNTEVTVDVIEDGVALAAADLGDFVCVHGTVVACDDNDLLLTSGDDVIYTITKHFAPFEIGSEDIDLPEEARHRIARSSSDWLANYDEWQVLEEGTELYVGGLVAYSTSGSDIVLYPAVISTDQNTVTAVSDIAVDSEDAAVVEYYNLQGVRVATPTPGLYIVRQGTKVAKQLIR